MRNTVTGFALVVALGLSLTACKDTKTLQENEQLKTQVADLQKQDGQLGNTIETLTADRDALAKENAVLKAEVAKAKGKPKPKAKAKAKAPASKRRVASR